MIPVTPKTWKGNTSILGQYGELQSVLCIGGTSFIKLHGFSPEDLRNRNSQSEDLSLMACMKPAAQRLRLGARPYPESPYEGGLYTL